MQKHTIGPWTADDKQGYWMVYAADKSGVAHVAPTSPDEGLDPEAEANALLIAAAPELLVALQALPLGSFGDDMDKHDAADFVDNAGAFFEAMLLAKAAIAKATGTK